MESVNVEGAVEDVLEDPCGRGLAAVTKKEGRAAVDIRNNSGGAAKGGMSYR